MQGTGAVLLAAAVVACGCSFALLKFAGPQAPPPSYGEGPTPSDRTRTLEAEQQKLADEVQQLSRRLDALEARRASVAPNDDLDARVRQAVQEALAQGSKEAAPAATSNATLDVNGALAKVTDPSLSWDEQQALWARIQEAGLADQVVAAIEAHAKANPDSPDAQTGKGKAYLQKLWTEKNDIAKGLLATKADAAFNDALELDPQRWDARFLKATSLSFWPPVMGKQPEAVKNFEILVEQQERSGRKQSGYDQTYLFLGNLYAQQGKPDKARETWQRGYDLFPNSNDLRDKLK